MSDPNEEAFWLDFQVQGGEVIAHVLDHGGHDRELHIWETWLRVRSDERAAKLVLTRHNGDLVDRPIGLFELALDAQQVAQLRSAIESAAWQTTPPNDRGDVTASQLTLDYRRGSLLLHRRFNARNREFMAAVWPALEAINHLTTALLSHPAAALQVSISSIHPLDDRGRYDLRMVMANPGPHPIVVEDPRAVFGDADVEPSRGYVLIATAPPENAGAMTVPPQWSKVALASIPASGNDRLVIPGRGQVEFNAPWHAPAAGHYLVQAVWSDYGGPLVGDPSDLPIMPLPGDNEGPITGVIYPVRGATFSSYASLAVDLHVKP